MKRVVILGSTGSIGTNAVAVARELPELVRVTGLSTHRNVTLLREQIALLHPPRVAVLDRAAARALRAEVGGATEVLEGPEGLDALAGEDEVDLVLNALVGFAGLRPTLRAVGAGRTLALANKESMVVAGELVTALAREHAARIIPIDSEHNAIWQCLAGEHPADVRRLILTASGGPFLGRDAARIEHASVAEALAHPRWKMGPKISIDSATLMNKGLEVHEAHWLFHVAAEAIDVVVHPQAVVHSMVEFIDGSIKAQLGPADMRLPIASAFAHPRRAPRAMARLDPLASGPWTFEAPDPARFPCLRLAYDALRSGGLAPVVLNAANECAVAAFLGGRIRFGDIARTVAATLDAAGGAAPALAAIEAADADARRRAELFIKRAC